MHITATWYLHPRLALLYRGRPVYTVTTIDRSFLYHEICNIPIVNIIVCFLNDPLSVYIFHMNGYHPLKVNSGYTT